MVLMTPNQSTTYQRNQHITILTCRATRYWWTDIYIYISQLASMSQRVPNLVGYEVKGGSLNCSKGAIIPSLFHTPYVLSKQGSSPTMFSIIRQSLIESKTLLSLHLWVQVRRRSVPLLTSSIGQRASNANRSILRSLCMEKARWS